MEWFRVALYLLGTSTALALAGQFLATRSPLAKMFALTMFAWAFNSAILCIMLIMHIAGQDTDVFRGRAFTLDALLLGLVPVALYISWIRQSREKHNA